MHCDAAAMIDSVLRAIFQPDLHWQVQLHRSRPDRLAALHGRPEEPTRWAWVDPGTAAIGGCTDPALHSAHLGDVLGLSGEFWTPSRDSQRHNDTLSAREVDVYDVAERIVGADHDA
eukprot:SAG31_NODE_22780_length_518_cov_0.620525_1_plen_116_part_10